LELYGYLVEVFNEELAFPVREQHAQDYTKCKHKFAVVFQATLCSGNGWAARADRATLEALRTLDTAAVDKAFCSYVDSLLFVDELSTERLLASLQRREGPVPRAFPGGSGRTLTRAAKTNASWAELAEAHGLDRGAVLDETFEAARRSLREEAEQLRCPYPADVAPRLRLLIHGIFLALEDLKATSFVGGAEAGPEAGASAPAISGCLSPDATKAATECIALLIAGAEGDDASRNPAAIATMAHMFAVEHSEWPRDEHERFLGMARRLVEPHTAF
jgi:hypothetical protein